MKVSEKNAQCAESTSNDPRWAAVVAHDARADGSFFYSVRTTGLYCRPSCAARPPRPETVAFHVSITEAERAGFRACKRCKPDQPPLLLQHAVKVTAACRTIEQADTAPSLAQLARTAGVSPFHFHRVCKTVAGVTPKQYADQHRGSRVREQLNHGGSVTQAIFDAGFNASSRFYVSASQLLGMTPCRFRRGGAESDIHFAVAQCSLGAIVVAQSERGVCASLMGDDADELVSEMQDRFPKANLMGSDNSYQRLIAQVIGFVAALATGRDLPLDARGTAFQQRVWQALREIPLDCTASYSDISRRIGAPKTARAVGQACAVNALAVAISCHRAVRNDGEISGHRWGAERKRALLTRESAT
jgi:AraC family transcriptional regulator of adaptative response/methylated-DNA-[protein]-cysteine methyltransferase